MCAVYVTIRAFPVLFLQHPANQKALAPLQKQQMDAQAKPKMSR
jgi:hypothetical protein